MSGPKHFQLVVPNYDQSGEQPRSPLSYFRLGADFQEDDDDPPADCRGDELLEGFFFHDDARTPTIPDKVYYREDGVVPEPDASGAVDPAYDPANGWPTTRDELTAELVTRGGWRDHTDGNRVSTTRGDQVDVVRGNYKLVVLARTAHHWDPTVGHPNPNVGRTRWESSGGHNNESTSTPGEVISISWVENEDGTWRAVEQTDGGNVKSFFYGRIEEHYFGPSIVSTVGVATDPSGCYGNGGGQGADRPDIEEDTFAQSITSHDTIGTVNETTVVSGAMTEETHIHESSTSTETANTHSSTEMVGAFADMLVADTINETNNFANGVRTNLTFGGVALSASLVGLHITAKNKLRVGLSLYPYQFSMEASAKVSFRTGAFTDIGIGASVGVGLTGLKAAFTLANVQLVGKRTDNWIIAQDGKATDLAWSNVRQIMAALKSVN